MLINVILFIQIIKQFFILLEFEIFKIFIFLNFSFFKNKFKRDDTARGGN